VTVTAAQALREAVDDVRALSIHAIDSPEFRRGARAALDAAVELLEKRVKDLPLGLPCRFPGCHRSASPETGMCGPHENVRVASSYVDDRHGEGGHG
jgi:hypothetical protein